MVLVISDGNKQWTMQSCQCGICGHRSAEECVKKECVCCSNFHLRVGPRTAGSLTAYFS